MIVLKFLFWFSLLTVFYSYFGYGILLWLLVRLKRLFLKQERQTGNEAFSPEVTLIVAAFNEAEFINSKIRNTLELDYDPEKLSIIFITDGSTDATPSIVAQYPQIRLLHEAPRKGKVAAMNRAMNFVKTPIVVFCDANTLLNSRCIKEIVKHYQDPRVGGVAGEKKVISTEAGHAAEVGEGIYWKYESFLKKLDSELYSVVGAAGELFSARTTLFEATREDIVIEDFVQSLRICMKGYVIRYEPAAYAMESSSISIKDEEKRKVRITAGAFQAMIILKDLFNIFKYPVLSFQFISHRVLRWTLCPLCLVLLFFCNLLIILPDWRLAPLFYTVLFAAQLTFYILAGLGWFLANRNIRTKVLYLPYYFLFMNVSVFAGFYRFIRKKQTVLWEKAARQKLA